MTVTVITPPDSDLIDFQVVKQHLRVDGSDDDALIDLYLAAAISALDGPGGWLGRALGQQTLELRTHCFGYPSLALPFPPLVEVLSVKYIDSAGDEQTVDPDLYTYADGLRLTYGSSWPTSRVEADAIRVRYTAGYTSDTLPAALSAAILLTAGELYARREITSKDAVNLSPTVEALAAPYRVWSI